jgi:predicted phage tail protein
MDSKQAKAIAVVDNMMAEGNELKKKYAEVSVAQNHVS